MKTVLTNGLIVRPSGTEHGNIVIDPPFIESVGGDYAVCEGYRIIDLHEAYVLPGVIDTHVHFREPGMTHKGTIYSESRAAAAGGVTSVLEMPNCKPTTTTLEALADKQQRAAKDSAVNCAFFIGATHDNIETLKNVDYTRVPGIKVFMGSSTGGMLLDNAESLHRVFSLSPSIPIVTHCEDTAIVNANAERYGDTTDFSKHTLIRSREACIASTTQAIDMARQCGTRLHVAHITTKEEIGMFTPNDNRITAEVCLPHLLFTDNDYPRLGSRIKCNPSVKTSSDREALRKALSDGRVLTVGTDHAPHTLDEKMHGGCLSAPSGMPMVQFSLPAMLSLVDDDVLTLPRLTQLMSLNPARLFGIDRRGEIREGNYADLAIVRPSTPYLISDSDALSLCHWTPMNGYPMRYRVESTYINGRLVWDGHHIVDSSASLPLRFIGLES